MLGGPTRIYIEPCSLLKRTESALNPDPSVASRQYAKVSFAASEADRTIQVMLWAHTIKCKIQFLKFGLPYFLSQPLQLSKICLRPQLRRDVAFILFKELFLLCPGFFKLAG
jgi:hypothetical protein